MSVLDIHWPLYAVVRHSRLSDGTIVANEGLKVFIDEAKAQRFCDDLIDAGTPERDLEIVSFAAQPELAAAR